MEQRTVDQRQLRAIVIAVLAVAGLVAFVIQPGKKGDDDSSLPVSAAPQEPTPPLADRPRERSEPRPPRALASAKRMTTAVLSGSPVPGVAKRTGDGLKRRGFRVGTVANAPTPIDRSSVRFAGRARSQARALARTLGIRQVGRLDPALGGAAQGARLVVIVGSDRGA